MASSALLTVQQAAARSLPNALASKIVDGELVALSDAERRAYVESLFRVLGLPRDNRYLALIERFRNGEVTSLRASITRHGVSALVEARGIALEERVGRTSTGLPEVAVRATLPAGHTATVTRVATSKKMADLVVARAAAAHDAIRAAVKCDLPVFEDLGLDAVVAQEKVMEEHRASLSASAVALAAPETAVAVPVAQPEPGELTTFSDGSPLPEEDGGLAPDWLSDPPPPNASDPLVRATAELMNRPASTGRYPESRFPSGYSDDLRVPSVQQQLATDEQVAEYIGQFVARGFVRNGAVDIRAVQRKTGELLQQFRPTDPASLNAGDLTRAKQELLKQHPLEPLQDRRPWQRQAPGMKGF